VAQVQRAHDATTNDEPHGEPGIQASSWTPAAKQESPLPKEPKEV
jgi:hypothetical protein